jgi:predicted XRE-type DNA-binding protein
MKEIWKDIKGYEGYYQVSSLGNVKSLYRIDIKGQKRCERILKLSLKHTGYLNVNLSKDCIKKYYRVHRLVAFAFLENPMNKPQVNHKNGEKTDNKVENLEWCTGSENTIHSFKNKLQPLPLGTKNSQSKLSESDVLEIKKLLLKKVKQKEIAKIFEISIPSVSNIKRNKNWIHI